MDDPEGRRTINDLLVGNVRARQAVNDRLFHVGRLDTDTEGLLILTNDGEFAHRLAHPSYEVPKTYLAEVAGVVTPGHAEAVAEGVTLDDGPVRPSRGQGRLHRRGEDAGEDHVAGRPQPDRAPYDGGGRPPGPASVSDRESGRYGSGTSRSESSAT